MNGEKRKEVNKKTEGITLIALVITIVVLLILAGVSIATLTGENGILTQAQNSKTANERGKAEESFSLVANEWKIEKYKTDGQTLEAFLNSKVTSNELDQVTANEDGTFTIVANGYQATMNANGELTGKIIKVGETPTQPTGGVTVESGTGKAVGDVVSITSTEGTTEKFYVIAYDETTHITTALAKYNLKVGNVYTSSSANTPIGNTEIGYGLQDSTMVGYPTDGGDPRNGVLAFSISRYWDSTYSPQGSSSYPYVYDSNSNLYTYVENYKAKLGNAVSEVRLASYEEINALWSNKSNYPWLYTSSYWLGSSIGPSATGVWFVFSNGNFNYGTCSDAYCCGVRLVITFAIS